MLHVPKSPTLVLSLVLHCALAAAIHGQESYSWQKPHAKVLPTGDIEWAPQPFEFVTGESVRYIDFEGGDDANRGTKVSPWRHHPWDPAARGRAAACEGVHTYVFKRGVVYRGRLIADESGRPGNAIRLTSDPSWGRGDAAIYGSELVTGWKKGADDGNIPERQKVWYADLDFTPRNIWVIDDSGIQRIPLARTPNWTVSDPDDVKGEWWSWDNPEKVWGDRIKRGDTESHIAYDTVHLTREADYYEGAYIWPEYGWVMSTPYPTRVLDYRPDQHALVFGGQWSNAAGAYHIPRFARYYLEDKPHYLDDPGEFWFARMETGGRIYLRLPGDADPRSVRVEAGKRLNLIDSEAISHVTISGLTFRFTNVFWDLDAPPTRDRDVDPACIRLLGSGSGIEIANCVFEHVHMPVRIKALGDAAVVDDVTVRDNVIRYTDHGAIWLADGGAWGVEYPQGRLLNVRVLRNNLYMIGMRPSRFGHGHAIELDCPQTAEVAGNVGNRLYGSGIFVYGGKRSAAEVDRPLTRILIHHNRIVDSLLNSNDWGGIETWQGGPAYVYDNVSGNPRGFKMWGHRITPDRPATSSFGHAYYMDGGFKQYYFNNIAWGRSKDPLGKLGNCSGFQEIHGYQASVFNNTVWNFIIGSRRQAPQAGRNKYLGNIWQSLGQMVFRHAQPAKLAADPNAADAGGLKSTYHHKSNAYARNVFSDVPDVFGVFEEDGRLHLTIETFKRAIAARRSLGDVGVVADESALRAPEKHDFRPTAAALDRGVRLFVPWGLYATVGEWPFYPAGDDPTCIMDEHFYMAPYYVNREDYHMQPTFPLKGVNVGATDYVAGPLEDWTNGALKLNGRNQYAVLDAALLRESPAEGRIAIRNVKHDWITFEAPERMTPGKPVEVKLHIRGLEPGLKLAADLHWRRGRQFAGMNAWGGGGQDIDGDGVRTVRFKPSDKPGLTSFIITAWVSPTGGWEDRVQVAQHELPRAADAPADGYRSPAVDGSNFLVEAYFRTEAGHTGGVLIEKMADAGYSLSIGQNGAPVFVVKAHTESSELSGKAAVNDGRWHHVIAECDRAASTLKLYVDGKPDVSGKGIGPDGSLTNDADLHAGGTPDGRCLQGTLEFLRVALGTLADSKTTVEELYEWQFNGPQFRDFCGSLPNGRRDAGAIELAQ